MTQLVELKQNRNFIEPDFPGYKLSLQEIPKSTINLSSKVHMVFPTNDQYTYKHAKLFSLHNHILASETDSLEGTEIVYYIGQDCLLYQVKWDILGVEEVCVNWKVPQGDSRQDYNFTMALPDENLAVVSNGSGNIYILDKRNEWKCIFNETLSFSAVIMDCNIKNNILQLVMYSIQSNNVQGIEDDGKHKSVIYWLQYQCSDAIWRQISMQEMQSESELHNVMLSADMHLYVLSSEGGFIEDTKDEETKPIKFTWCQCGDSINIYIKGTSVDVKNKHILVKNHDEVVLDGILYGTVDTSMTTWTTSRNGVLEIALCKEEAESWPELIAGLPMLGECLPDEQTAKNAHEKMSHLCSTAVAETIATKTATLTDQVEECDFVSSKGALIERITPERQVSHRVMLTQEIIFVDSALQRFAIQQNEDVCLYEPSVAKDTNAWHLEHIGTLFALGYIRASKQRRKFTTSAPDLSYSIVAEGTRHVFIYRQHVEVTSGELRHRTSGKRIKQFAQQQVIELEKHDVILGVKATNTNLFVLTEHKAYVFKMN